MKHNTLVISISLLCSLLLSLSPACGKKDPSSGSQTPEPSRAMSQTPEPSTETPPTTSPTATPRAAAPTATPPTAKASTAAPVTPDPSPSPQPSPLRGTYTLNDPGATERIKQAIEVAVEEVSILIRGLVRGELKKKNLPPPQKIDISYTSTEVSITTDRAGLIQTPVNGTFVDRTMLGEKLKVSTKWKGEELERTFKGGEGQRVNTYSLSGDGRTLTMHVKVTSPRLRRPCAYELTYSRTTK